MLWLLAFPLCTCRCACTCACVEEGDEVLALGDGEWTEIGREEELKEGADVSYVCT